MVSKTYNTVVVLPDSNSIEVDYYCVNIEKKTKLFIQLHDCHCIIEIDKNICNKPEQMERMVQAKVLNTKGDLC